MKAMTWSMFKQSRDCAAVQKVQRNCKAVCGFVWRASRYRQYRPGSGLHREGGHVDCGRNIPCGLSRGGAYTILPGDRLVLINKSPTLYDRRANL